MKKRFILLLSIALVIVSFSAVFAQDAFDLSVFDNAELFDIYFSEEKDRASIEAGSFATVEEKSFTHPYEHPEYYSYVYTDLYVRDYDTDAPRPFLRTWVEFSTTKRIDVTSMTITLADVDYTFTEIDNHIEEDDAGYVEYLFIIYGPENVNFLNAFYNFVTQYLSVEDPNDIPPIPFVLHGTEDVAGEINGYAALDFYIMFYNFAAAHGLDYLKNMEASTPMEMAAAQK